MIVRIWIAVLVTGFTFFPASAQERRPLDRLFDFKSIKSAVISPDGKTVACLVGTSSLKDNRLRTDLWLVPTHGGNMQRVELETDALEQVLWSPKGSRLVVQGTLVAQKESWLWTVDLPSMKTKRLTSVDRGNHYLAHQGANLAWAPDGASVAYLAADTPPPAKNAEPLVIDRIQYKTRTAFSDNRASQIWVVDVENGKTRQVTSGKHNVHSIAWSPKGNQMIACSNREENPDKNLNNDLILIKLSDGTETEITKTAGNEMSPVFCSDGKRIAYTMTSRRLTTIDSVAEDANVWYLDLESGQNFKFAEALDRRCSHLSWAGDETSVFALVRDHCNVLIYQLMGPRNHGTRFKVEGAISEFSLSPTREGCCVLSSPLKPAEVYLFSENHGESKQLTFLNTLAAERWSFVKPQPIKYRSFDEASVQGWIAIPRTATNDKKCPLILNVHGGPHGMHSNAFSAQTQILVERGYAVLALNPRGSTGYGQAFADGCHNDWGGGDFKDLMAGIDHALKAHPELDGERLGIMGGSYGGYMSNWTITQTDRFKAAVSYAGLSNLISFYATSLYQDLIHVEFGGRPWDKYDTLWDRSPLCHIKKARTPTLLLHGEADNDVHITQSEEMYTALKWRGVESVFVRYPRQGHGATEPRQQLDMLERTISWFDRHLAK